MIHSDIMMRQKFLNYVDYENAIQNLFAEIATQKSIAEAKRSAEEHKLRIQEEKRIAKEERLRKQEEECIAEEKRIAEKERLQKQREYEVKVSNRRSEYDKIEMYRATLIVLVVMLPPFITDSMFDYSIFDSRVAVILWTISMVLTFTKIDLLFYEIQVIKASGKSIVNFISHNGTFVQKGDDLLRVNGVCIKAEQFGFFVITDKDSYKKSDTIAKVTALHPKPIGEC